MPDTLEKSQSDILERLLKQGLKFQKLGQNELAHQAYSVLLEVDPHQSDANYNMGLLAFNSGKDGSGTRIFRNGFRSQC